MIKSFKKDKTTLVRAKVRISAMFDEEGEVCGAYVLKSGLRRTTNHDPHRSSYVIDFQEPVTWTKSMHESMYITVCGYDVIHLNEKLNHLMLDFIRAYDSCYNSSIHPFYVITDVDYFDEKPKEMVIEYRTKRHSKLKEGQFTPLQVFMSIVQAYFCNVIECTEDGFNFKARVMCTNSRFNVIKRELLTVLTLGDKSVSNVKVLENSKRKCVIAGDEDS